VVRSGYWLPLWDLLCHVLQERRHETCLQRRQHVGVAPPQHISYVIVIILCKTIFWLKSLRCLSGMLGILQASLTSMVFSVNAETNRFPLSFSPLSVMFFILIFLPICFLCFLSVLFSFFYSVFFLLFFLVSLCFAYFSRTICFNTYLHFLFFPW